MRELPVFDATSRHPLLNRDSKSRCFPLENHCCSFLQLYLTSWYMSEVPIFKEMFLCDIFFLLIQLLLLIEVIITIKWIAKALSRLFVP